MVNVISLGISSPSCKKWEKKQTQKSYIEYQRMRFSMCGKLRTQTLYIVSKGNNAYIITSIKTIKTSVQAVLDHMGEILEFGRSMPLMVNVPKVSASFNDSLPSYGEHVQTRAEEYAERLKADKWDVRKYDPAEIPQEWKAFGKVRR